MIDLREIGLLEGLPPAVADEPWVRIMDKVYRARHQREMEAAERIRVYTQIDSQPEEILDLLAVQFKVDWYDPDYPLQAKRNIIKTALEVRRFYGTDWATLKAISAIYPQSEIEQWYDYEGTPGHFRVICSVDGALIPVRRREIRRSVNIYKRTTAHLDSLYLQVQSGLEIECELSSMVYHIPYASETMFAGTWPRTTTHAGIVEAEMTVESEAAANAFCVETAGTIPYRTTHAGIMDVDFMVETEHATTKSKIPYTSESQFAGTWPKTTTHAGIAEVELTVESEAAANTFRVETSGTIPYRATHAGMVDADFMVEAEHAATKSQIPYTSENQITGTWPKNTTKAAFVEAELLVEGETEEHKMEVTMSGTETCASNIPAILDEPVLSVDIEVTATKFKGKNSGEELLVE